MATNAAELRPHGPTPNAREFHAPKIRIHSRTARAAEPHKECKSGHEAQIQNPSFERWESTQVKEKSR